MSPPNDGGPVAVNAEANHRTTEPNHNHEVHDQCSGSPGQEAAAYVAGLHRRRQASYRLPVLESGHADPWRYDEPGERGYSDAAHHLLSHGLTPAPHRRGLHRMWPCGDVSRRAAQVIAERWELAG